jgi:hypothetical protein
MKENNRRLILVLRSSQPKRKKGRKKTKTNVDLNAECCGMKLISDAELYIKLVYPSNISKVIVPQNCTAR